MEVEAGISLDASGASGGTPLPTTPNLSDIFSFFVDPFSDSGSFSFGQGGTSAGASSASSVQPYYTVQVDEPFTGFLQHFVTDPASGAIADMSAVCMM